jgi:hypothetical protein
MKNLDGLEREEIDFDDMEDNYYPRTPPWWMAFIPCAFLVMLVLLLYVLVWS